MPLFYQMSRVTYFFPIESAKLDPSDIAYRMDTTQYLPSPSRNFHQIYHNSYHRAAKNFLFFSSAFLGLIGTRFLAPSAEPSPFSSVTELLSFLVAPSISRWRGVFSLSETAIVFFLAFHTINIAVLMHVLFL